MSSHLSNEELRKLAVLAHITHWKKIKNRDMEVHIPFLNFNPFMQLATPLIFDEDESPFGGEFLINKGLFERKQFLRIFLTYEDCYNYMTSKNVIRMIAKCLKSGNSYLNYLTYTGSMGDNDSQKVFESMEMVIRSTTSLEKYIHYICLDIAVRSIEGCVLFKESFHETKWFSQLHDAFDLEMDVFPLSMFFKIKNGLEEVWDKKTIYEFLKGNTITNIKFIIDCDDIASKTIKPNSFCVDAPSETGEVHFSLINYISEYI